MHFFKNWLETLLKNIEALDSKEKCDTVTKESMIGGNGDVGLLIKTLDTYLDKDICVKALENCGRMCLDPQISKQAKIFFSNVNDMDLLLAELNKQGIGGGNMYMENNTVFASYSQCYCPTLGNADIKVSPTYCNCSRGWFKGFFETVLDKPVEVELLESIVQGGSSCRFKIHI